MDLAEYGIEKFAYRWVNCILTREFSMDKIVRIWDTLLSEEMDISVALEYLCSAMLLMMASDLKTFSGAPDEIIMYLQDPPSSKWGEQDIQTLMARSYELQTLFKNNQHLTQMA